VLDYGAVADGRDCRAAFQGAVDACEAGDTVWVPPGRYEITGTVLLKSDMTLLGAGPENTVLHMGRKASPQDADWMLEAVQKSAIAVRGLCLQSEHLRNALGDLSRSYVSGLHLDRSYDCEVDLLVTRGLSLGLGIDGTTFAGTPFGPAADSYGHEITAWASHEDEQSLHMENSQDCSFEEITLDSLSWAGGSVDQTHVPPGAWLGANNHYHTFMNVVLRGGTGASFRLYGGHRRPGEYGYEGQRGSHITVDGLTFEGTHRGVDNWQYDHCVYRNVTGMVDSAPTSCPPGEGFWRFMDCDDVLIEEFDVAGSPALLAACAENIYGTIGTITLKNGAYWQDVLAAHAELIGNLVTSNVTKGGAAPVPLFNVLAYGADPTGALDSAPAINAAVAACPVGGTVYVPAGTYLVATPIILNGSIGVALQGDGAASVLHRPVSGPTDLYQIIEIKGGAANVIVRQLKLASNEATIHPGRYAIRLIAPTTNVTLDHLWFEGVDVCVRATGLAPYSNTNTNLTITNLVGVDPVAGLYLANIAGGYIAHVQMECYRGDYGSYSAPHHVYVAARVTNLVIEDCLFTGGNSYVAQHYTSNSHVIQNLQDRITYRNITLADVNRGILVNEDYHDLLFDGITATARTGSDLGGRGWFSVSNYAAAYQADMTVQNFETTDFYLLGWAGGDQNFLGVTIKNGTVNELSGGDSEGIGTGARTYCTDLSLSNITYNPLTFSSSPTNYLRSNHTAWSTAQTGANLTVTAATGRASLGDYKSAAGVHYIYQILLSFDTSALTGETPIGAALELAMRVPYVVQGGPWTLDVYAFDWGPTAETADWRTVAQLAALTKLGSFAQGSISGSDKYDVVLSGAGLAGAVDPEGMTYLLLAFSSSQDTNPPIYDGTTAGRRIEVNMGGTYPPQLRVWY